MDEQIGVVDVFDAYPQMADARRRVVRRDRFAANRHNVGYAPVSERPGRNGSVDPRKRVNKFH